MNSLVNDHSRRRGSHRRCVSACALLLGLGALAAQPASARADAMDRAIREVAPKVISYLQEHKYQNVGVLKFRVDKGKGTPTLSAGSANTHLALALRNALILLDDEKKPINILDHPAEEALALARGPKGRPQVTYTTEKGRASLFNHEYRLAWGNTRVAPDAFLTGDLEVSKDMKSARLVIKAFTRNQPVPAVEVAEWKFATDRALLANIGQSFVVSRNARQFTEDANTNAANNAANGDANNQNPSQSPDAPVKLEIYFDNTPVTTVPDATSPGEDRIRREKTGDIGQEGKKVQFFLTNTSDDTVGVLLAINGVSTLDEENVAEKTIGGSRLWVLEKGVKYKIDGYYQGNGGNYKPFKVLDIDQSALTAQAMDPNVAGVISMYVLQRAKAPVDNPGPPDVNLANTDGTGTGAGNRSARPRSLAQAQANLRKSTGAAVKLTDRGPRLMATGTRQRASYGLVVPGEVTPGDPLKQTQFVADPQPIFTRHIRYYETPNITGTGTNPN